MGYKLKMKATLLLLLSAIIIISGCSNANLADIMNADKDNIIEHIEFLTSEELQGRRLGTVGNEAAVNYVKEQFKSYGLVPAFNDVFLHGFRTVTPELNKPIEFKVFDQEGNYVKSYKQGVDFLARTDGFSLGGSFRGGIVYPQTYTEIMRTDDPFLDLAVIIDYNNPDFRGLREHSIDERLTSEKAAVVIYHDQRPMDTMSLAIGSKSVFVPTRGPIKLGVSDVVYHEIVKFKEMGYQLDIQSELFFTPVEGYNLMAMVPGKSRQFNNYIMLATSIDGLGINEHGDLMEGASENASSVALLLEMARVMTENNIQLSSNVVFAVFNGKQQGNIGINTFLRNRSIPFSRIQVIYLENLAVANNPTINLMTFQDPSSKRARALRLVNQLTMVAEDMGLEYMANSTFAGGGHMPFRSNGVVASLITQSNHNQGRPSDTTENLYLTPLLDIGDLLIGYMDNYGGTSIGKEIVFLLRSFLWLIAILMIFLFLKLYLLPKIRISYEPLKKFVDFPIITMLVLFMLFSSVLYLQTLYHRMDVLGLPISEVSITITDVMKYFSNSVFPFVVMTFYLMLYFLPILTLTIVIGFTQRTKPLYLQLIASGVIAILIMLFPFSKFYNYEYSILLPQMFSPAIANYLAPIVVAIVAFITMVIWLWEYKLYRGYQATNMVVLICFIGLFFILLHHIYAPYMFTREMLEVGTKPIRF